MDLIKGKSAEIDIHDELLQARAHVWNHLYRFLSSFSLKSAVQLEIPDMINKHGQSMTLSELASALPIHPTKVQCLHRLMRILVHSGFFVYQQLPGQNNKEKKGYFLNPASRLLLKDDPSSIRPYVLAVLDPVLMKPGHYMSTWFQTDEPSPFSLTYGKSFWDYVGHESDLNNFFNEAMATDSNLIASLVISKCEGVFEGLSSLVDVGGGTGTFAKILAKAFPRMDCMVFDLPHVVAGLEGNENLQYVEGNMFDKVPSADAVMLKWVLHDWNDEDCVKILKRCKEAIGSKEKGGKVIIIDMIMGNLQQDGEQNAIETQLFFDMEMMMLVSGQERNEEEWSKLFNEAGFTEYKIISTLGLRSLIELYL